MARPRRDVSYDATPAVRRECFREGVELDRERAAVQQLNSAYNKACGERGVHAGSMALARRLRRIGNLDKRRLELRQYAVCLVELENEILEQETAQGHNGGPALEEEDARPFAARTAA